MSPPRTLLAVGLVLASPLALLLAPEATASLAPGLTDAQVYTAACAACHGADGRGVEAQRLVFTDPPVPDFTDCNFNSREPAADWAIVGHQGGPIRGFSEIMPSYGEALTQEQLEAAVRHIKGFCQEDGYPSGIHNLPRPLYTSKAYVEDEVVLTVTADPEGQVGVTTDLIYEKRFGKANNFEVKFPWRDVEAEQGWEHGMGDMALALKRNVVRSAATGSIVGLTAEVVVPTGSAERGLGKGYGIFEPFATYGQGLPLDAFFQAQVGAEIPMVGGHENEVFWRGALGKSFFAGGGHGRVWSPMVEVLGATALEDGATPEWALVPQVHLTLNTRQHIMLVAGARMPMADEEADTQVRVSLLWDWFDGGFRDGW